MNSLKVNSGITQTHPVPPSRLSSHPKGQRPWRSRKRCSPLAGKSQDWGWLSQVGLVMLTMDWWESKTNSAGPVGVKGCRGQVFRESPSSGNQDWGRVFCQSSALSSLETLGFMAPLFNRNDIPNVTINPLPLVYLKGENSSKSKSLWKLKSKHRVYRD